MEGLLKHGVVHGMDGQGTVAILVFGIVVGLRIVGQQYMVVHGLNDAKQQIIAEELLMIHGIVIIGGEKRDLQHPMKL